MSANNKENNIEKNQEVNEEEKLDTINPADTTKNKVEEKTVDEKLKEAEEKL